MTISPPFALRGDRPIETAEEDRLGRAPFSRAIAAQILEAPALDSYVVAIMGPWGSGKTSLINMIAEEAQLRSDAVVLKFNPWVFSGTEQLVGYFFRELGAQFSERKNDRLAAIGASLKKYAGLFGSFAQFIPTVGGVAKKGAEVAKDAGGALAEVTDRLGQLSGVAALKHQHGPQRTNATRRPRAQRPTMPGAHERPR